MWIFSSIICCELLEDFKTDLMTTKTKENNLHLCTPVRRAIFQEQTAAFLAARVRLI